MFTFEIKINGALIAHIYGKNTLVYADDGDTVYDYEYYEVASRKVTKGSVLHDSKSGIRPLITTILNDIT
jgi:hypothetical protein